MLDMRSLKGVVRPENDDPSKVLMAVENVFTKHQAEVYALSAYMELTPNSPNEKLQVITMCFHISQMNFGLFEKLKPDVNPDSSIDIEPPQSCIELIKRVNPTDATDLMHKMCLMHYIGLWYRMERALLD
jgi:hypothetical protein